MPYRHPRSASPRRAVILFGLLLSSLLLAAPPASGQQTAARPDRGAVTGAAYAVSDVESINLNNGNLSLSIPLASLPPMAGGKLSWTVSATYNSKLWDVTREQKDYTPDQQWQPYTVDTPQQSALGGWRVGGAYQIVIRNAREDVAYKIPPWNALPSQEYELIANRQWFKVLLRTPDGAERELRPVGPQPYNGTYYDFLRGYYDFQPSASNPVRYSSFDGTFLTAVVKAFNDWTLFMPDGTQVVQIPEGIQRVRDTNGNSIKIFSAANVDHYQDERTGREIRVAYDPAANGGQGQYQVWYQTAGGGWAMVVVNIGVTRVQGKIYGVTDWHPTGGELREGVTCTRDELLTPVDTPINIPVVREIVFPQTQPDKDAPRFGFGYNGDATETFTTNMFRPACGMPFETFTATASVGWGALNHMVTPLGAEVSYSYSLDSNHSAGQLSADASAEERVVRKVVRHDGEEDEWRYDEGGVTNPDGTLVRHWAFGHGAGYPNFGVGAAGLVFRTEGPGVTVERHWTSLRFSGASLDSPGGAVTYNPVVDAEYTTLLEPPSPGASPVPVKMSAKTFKHEYNGNVTEVKEYDWFSPSLVTRDGLGVPTGVPAGATLLRTTLTGYHNSPGADSASMLVYAKRPITAGTPSIINAVRETAAGAAVARMSYDGQAYGAAPTKGLVTQVSRLDDKGDADAANDTWVSTSSTYDATYGNVLTATDALGRVTQFFYDDAVKALPTRVVVDPQNGTGQQTSTTVYDPSTGLVTSTTDPNGQTSEVSYVNQLLGAVDPFGRPGVMTSPAVTVGGASKRRKSFTFYEDAARRARVESDLNDEGDRVLKSRETRDELGRVVLSEQNEGGASYTVSSRTVYAEKGRVMLKSHPTRGDGTLTDGWTRVTNDDRGRVVEAATFQGAGQPAAVTGPTPDPSWKGSVRTQYYANETTVTDQMSKSRKSVTDALGGLVEVVEAPNAPGYGFVTSYAYDSLGNLRRVDQGGQLRYFAYDSLGRLIRAKNPEQGNLAADGDFPALIDSTSGSPNSDWSLAYKYDANGNLIKRKDARNVTTAYTYDALNRSKTVDYSDTGAGVDVERYYDGATRGKGRLWTTYAGGPSATATEHTAVDAYDELGRPLTQRQLFRKADGNWQTYPVGRTYDLSGNVLTQTYPSGRSVSYTYDAAGRLAGFAGNLGDGAQRTYSSATLYDAAGRVRQERFGTQTPLYNKRFYNVAGQMTNVRLSTYSIVAPGQDGNWNRGAIVNHYSNQTWAGSGTDNNGNLKKQEIYIPHDDAVSASTQIAQHFDYDELSRLKSVTEYLNNQTQSFKQAYAYDRFGNRTIDAVNTSDAVAGWDVPAPAFEQDAANPAYREVAAPSNRLYAPGDGGRMPGQKLMSYDAAGNLVKDTYQGGQGGGGTRTYDAEGRMTVAQLFNGQTQEAQYTYDADGRRVRRKTTTMAEVWQVYGMGGELLAEYGAAAAPTNPQKEYGYRNGELLVTAEPQQEPAGTTPNASAFVSQSLPAAMLAGHTYAASVTFRNTGSNTWAAAGQYRLGSQNPQDNNTWGAGGGRVSLPSSVAPNGEVTFDFTVTAPPSPGTYDFRWRMVQDGVEWFGDYTTNLAVTVSAPPAPRPNDAQGTWQSVPRVMTAGQSYAVTVKMKNTGTSTWTSAGHYNLGSQNPQDNGTWGVYRAALSATTAPGAEATFSFTVTAPTSPGTYDFRWRMVQDWVEWFGDYSTNVAVTVNAAGDGSTGGGVRWLVSDQLGTPRMVVDETGSLTGVKRHDYLPFGEEIGAGISGRTQQQGYSQPSGIRQGFTGYEMDGETGLNFAQARYHSPTMGRFTSPDPLLESGDPGLPQSWNRYTYVLNNPLLFVDPTGLIWGYKDREDGLREFAWCAGDKPCEGYEPYTDYTYTFGDGRVVWFNQEEGTWGVVEPIRPVDSCLYCQGLIDEMARRGPVMEKTILAVTAANLAPAVAIVGSGTLGGVGTATLGLGGAKATAYAIRRLRNLSGLTRARAREALQKEGFKSRGPNSGGYEKWKHSDGSEVWIRPDGEIVRIPSSGAVREAGKSGKGWRVDPDGNLGRSHNTGERVQ